MITKKFHYLAARDGKLAFLKILACQKTGSSFTVDPPVLTTDEDWLLLVESLDVANSQLAFDGGWENCLEEAQAASDKKPSKDFSYAAETSQGARFSAWRKTDEDGQEINLIITDDKSFYIRSVAATFLCKALNVKSKKARIELFWAVKFGTDYDIDNLS